MNTANNNKHPLVEGPNQGAKQLDQEGAKTLSNNFMTQEAKDSTNTGSKLQWSGKNDEWGTKVQDSSSVQGQKEERDNQRTSINTRQVWMQRLVA